ncbi:MAG: hypothetical protein O7A69_10105 [SAR324 cluster bacterium]|nr:hypothetical protein [SAR324 cluster bacterium]
MKFLTRLRKLALLLAATGWAATAFSAPQYTDKENALNLAEALDKGIYRNNLITSTFIQSVGKGRYFIKVILDNGAEHNWDLRQVRARSKIESLVLRKNQALLFPSEDSNDFAILAKSAFSRTALRAKVYTKRFGDSDVLAGQEINFGIHRFNLVDLLRLKPGRDEQGYPHHYVLDLENGQRELLSYLDAYHAMARKALIADPASVTPVLRSPYRIRSVKPIALGEMGPTGTGSFGVEMTFDRAVALQPGHFPFRFRENGNGKSGAHPRFVVEITAPNAVMEQSVGKIETLEFLRNIHVVSDSENPVRLLLRAAISPEVMNFPPQVEVLGSTVLVSFKKVVDQSVFDQQELAKQDLLLRQDRLLHRELSPEEVRTRNVYEERLREGDTLVHQARKATPFAKRFSLLSKAAGAYQEAAANSSTDGLLAEALRKRNVVMVKMPVLVITHAEHALRQRSLRDPGELRRLLEEAALLTRDKQLLQTIRRLLTHPKL